MIRRVFTLLCSFILLLIPFAGHMAAVSPSVIELSGLRGETVESSFMILNTGASERLYFLDVMAFEPSGEDGTPVFTSKTTTPEGILSWMNFSIRDVLVPANSKVDVPFTVVVPNDVPSGSYNMAITVSTAPSDVVATNGATIEAKTAVLVLLTIGGDTTERLGLLEFAFDQTNSTLPFGTFRYRLQNQGNVHLTPIGQIKLIGIFGQAIASVNANETDGRVLPSSTRTYEVVLGSNNTNWFERAGYQLEHLLIGPVTATLELSYGETGSISAQTSIWVVPVELIVLLTAGLLLILLIYKELAKRK